MEPQWKAISERVINDAQAARFLKDFVRRHGNGSSYLEKRSHANSSIGHSRLHQGEQHHQNAYHDNTPNSGNPKGVLADIGAVYQSVAAAAATSGSQPPRPNENHVNRASRST